MPHERPDALEIAALRRQITALADFMTALGAALIADDRLPALVVEAMAAEDSLAPAGNDGGEVTVARLAYDTMAIAGQQPMPSPIRLIHDADAANGHTE